MALIGDSLTAFLDRYVQDLMLPDFSIYMHTLTPALQCVEELQAIIHKLHDQVLQADGVSPKLQSVEKTSCWLKDVIHIFKEILLYVTVGTFYSMDLALFFSTSYLITTCDNLITRYTIFNLFSHEIHDLPYAITAFF